MYEEYDLEDEENEYNDEETNEEKIIHGFSILFILYILKY